MPLSLSASVIMHGIIAEYVTGAGVVCSSGSGGGGAGAVCGGEVLMIMGASLEVARRIFEVLDVGGVGGLAEDGG